MSLMQVVEQILDAGHMNQEDFARLRAAWEAVQDALDLLASAEPAQSVERATPNEPLREALAGLLELTEPLLKKFVWTADKAGDVVAIVSASRAALATPPTAAPAETLPHFATIWTICRLALHSPTDALLHQIERLAHELSGQEQQRLQVLVHRAKNPAPQRPATPLVPSTAAPSQEAAQVQEPVGHVVSNVDGSNKRLAFYSTKALHETPLWTKLYAAPPQKAEPAEWPDYAARNLCGDLS